ncbi:thiol peroxidase [Heliophilum fasciatum]|uniref:Thiol peroxidase n=1 Tax=Heliophilum fasciatum TaxID=35700 RepID=A0A4R2RZB1_9FIRM|nr:thiol peroxidase [Heliophilum fasciatum]MCW2276745.1 thiol peroxidase [Heliophilum fasciatum]TCP68874.1 thiol peroxidase (atypical 2-Cys peroxiredoxin) [Heliophilum fasciatum]
MIERPEAATFAGSPMTLIGPIVQVGETAPPFTVIANDLSIKTLADYAGKVRLISVVPSLDTPVCDMQTRRFNQEAAALGSDIVILTISCDLPFAQARWCGSAGVDRVITLSDHKHEEFGRAFGALIKELRLLSRAIFVIDRNDRVTYTEYVPEITSEPDYDQALAAAKAALDQ